MSDNQTPLPQESFLVADCGSVNTRVALFDVVDGVYRFITAASAPTTVSAPWSDLTRGLQHSINRVSETTGRMLLGDGGELITPSRVNGAGVDHFAAAISAAEPLRCILIGLLDDVSLSSARHALSHTYAHIIDAISLTDSRSEQQQMQAIANHKPDLIFISGGSDGGADARVLQLVETVSLGLNMLGGVSRPQVVYAGNAALRERVSEILGGLTTLHVADNVRPSLEVEQLGDAARVVHAVYNEMKVGTAPGIEEVAAWSDWPPTATADAFATVVEYFAALYEGGVLGVDLGGSSVTLVAAEPHNVRTVVRSDLGMGRPIAGLFDHVSAQEMRRWLPTAVDEATLHNALVDKSLRPQTIPATEEELRIEQAAAREILRQAMLTAPVSWRGKNGNSLPPFNLLLARGMTLTHAPRPGQALLMLLDALQPTGIFSVAIDRHGVLPALGALASHEPLLVVQALEGGVLTDLGFVIVPSGRAQEGQKVVTIHLENERIGKLELEVAHGAIEVVPLPPGQSAELTLKPARGIDVGFGPGKGKQVQVHGGAVGLVVDARGRPLPLPDDDEARQTLMRRWLWDVGG